MAWMLLALVELPLLFFGIVVIASQRDKLSAQKRETQKWHGEYEAANRAFHQAWNKFSEIANRDPIVIQPPDVAKIVHEVGESIGTAIYGRQQEIAKDLQDQVRQTSMVEEKIAPNEWFPDVEFDEQMGPMPTHGGWVNPQTNGNTTPGTDQTPVHGIVNGKLVRLDGQPAFAPGTTAPMPQGGVE